MQAAADSQGVLTPSRSSRVFVFAPPPCHDSPLRSPGAAASAAPPSPTVSFSVGKIGFYSYYYHLFQLGFFTESREVLSIGVGMPHTPARLS